jgi:hypothetical protein
MYSTPQKSNSHLAYSVQSDVEKLLQQMTTEEKIGQMNQYNDGTSTGILNNLKRTLNEYQN